MIKISEVYGLLTSCCLGILKMIFNVMSIICEVFIIVAEFWIS